MLHEFIFTLLDYLKEIAEVAVLGFFVAGLFNAYIRKETIIEHLGKGGIRGNAIASVVGFIMPLCCCSAIPTAITLYRRGAGRGPACAFLIATPWFNFYGFASLAIFLGWRVAIFVSLASVVIAFCSGMIIDVFTSKSPVIQAVAVTITSHDSCNDGCGSSCAPLPNAGKGWIDFSNHRAKFRIALHFMRDLGREIGLWILIGVLLGALVETFVPESLFTNYLGGDHVLGLLVAIAIAGIFYTDSLGSLPWVHSLLAKGLGSGSAMTLLVAGVGTNISTLGPIARNMGRRTAVLYASSVVVFTGAVGVFFNLIR